MGSITVTLIANAGVCIEIQNKRIWVDALHEKKVPGFSTVTEDLFTQILHSERFHKPDAICFTHRHGDHYSFRQLHEVIRHWPEAQVFLPGDTVPPEGGEFDLGEIRIRFVRLPHEGAQYADVCHYGILILSPERNVFVSGDCALACPEVADMLKDIPVDTVILDFPWVTLKKGRNFTEQHWKNAHILLVHLPFAEDDCNGYREAAKKAVKVFLQDSDIRLMLEPFQTEIFP